VLLLCADFGRLDLGGLGLGRVGFERLGLCGGLVDLFGLGSS
jgi:hypothetical protein